MLGVNTGFGGSADTRTSSLEELQKTLIRQFHSGILVGPNILKPSSESKEDSVSRSSATLLEGVLPVNDPTTMTCMPEAWARATMAIRVNSLAKGYSGVRVDLIQRILDLLNKNITPQIPLRGSISASGDLMPLSYVGGALQGSPSIMVWTGEGRDRRVATAEVALRTASLQPISLGPKEGLAIVNGTAASTGVAALAMHDANCLAVLAQVLTAMSIAALTGTDESVDPFFARVRPHPGQMESSHNIRAFVKGSKLVQHNDGRKEGVLRQDRYSIRTAAQWIGPVLEDLQLATQQVTIECNSTTDNPLIEPQSGRMLHGGNFQAKALTSAMEKTRSGLQSLGQMLFAQCTELINPKTNNGLAPNLAADEPSESFLMKPIDIMIAALQSELGFLSNTVGNHVLSAEMGNQSLNSLALISARYTHTALDVLSQLCAAQIFALCQALDLRVMDISFLEVLQPIIRSETKKLLNRLGQQDDLEDLWNTIWSELLSHLDHTTSMNSEPRFTTVFKLMQSTLIEFISSASADSIPALKEWRETCRESALKAFHSNIESYSAHPNATPYLGLACSRIYNFVRQDLSVPFFRADEKMNCTVGACTTAIYQSIRNGTMFLPVMECLREAGNCSVG